MQFIRQDLKYNIKSYLFTLDTAVKKGLQNGIYSTNVETIIARGAGTVLQNTLNVEKSYILNGLCSHVKGPRGHTFCVHCWGCLSLPLKVTWGKPYKLCRKVTPTHIYKLQSWRVDSSVAVEIPLVFESDCKTCFYFWTAKYVIPKLNLST